LIRKVDDISVYANLTPNNIEIGGNTIGTETKPWRTGHFHNVYAKNIIGKNEEGYSRRVLLEGESLTISYDDLDYLSDLATVATTGS
jgi:hypothetical protein